MIRDVLEASRRSALDKAGLEPPDSITLERPARREHGDWSSNVALATAKAAGRNPRELAARIAEVLEADPPMHVERVEIAGPGFINFHLAPTWLHAVLGEVVEAGEASYARHDFGVGERVQVEFVSANPTGPIHVGNGWFASYGDSVARLLERCGYEVSREYYVNDTGGQIRRLGESVLARRAAEPVPEGGYPSGFVKGLASAYDGPEDVDRAGRWAADLILKFIQNQMASVNIAFDEWFSQASIQESDAVVETIAELQDRGLVWEEDGALWLNTADFGDPRRRRVLRKSLDQGGDYTYLAGDLAYHRNKFMVRGFDRVIDVWGADHQGEVTSITGVGEGIGVEGVGSEVAQPRRPPYRQASRHRRRPRRLRRRHRRRRDAAAVAGQLHRSVTHHRPRQGALRVEGVARLLRPVRQRPDPLDRQEGGRARRDPGASHVDARPGAADSRARARPVAHAVLAARGRRAGVRGAGPPQGDRLGARAGRPIPRLLPRLSRAG